MYGIIFGRDVWWAEKLTDLNGDKT